MRIRKLTINDVSKLCDISRKTFIEAFEHQNNPDDFYAYVNAAFTIETLTTELNTEGVSFYFVEDEALAPIAYIKLTENKSPLQTSNPKIEVDFNFEGIKATELDRIYLFSEHHGKGVAQIAMNHVMAVAKDNGSHFVWLGVWEHNPKAIRFYEKMGFEKFGTHIFDIGEDPQTDWMMWQRV
jgi:diamine N-acetyltransferase